MIEIDVIVARIETLAVDAIVNAANRALLPGGGVDGAIRRAAGQALNELLLTYGGLDEGKALVTPAFKLPAASIIHTVAPVWFAPGDDGAKIERLRACYASCLAEAHRHGFAVVAFPALGTGAFGWPRDLGAGIAVAATRAAPAPPKRVIFCCFTDADADIYRAALA